MKDRSFVSSAMRQTSDYRIGRLTLSLWLEKVLIPLRLVPTWPQITRRETPTRANWRVIRAKNAANSKDRKCSFTALDWKWRWRGLCLYCNNEKIWKYDSKMHHKIKGKMWKDFSSSVKTIWQPCTQMCRIVESVCLRCAPLRRRWKPPCERN